MRISLPQPWSSVLPWVRMSMTGDSRGSWTRIFQPLSAGNDSFSLSLSLMYKLLNAPVVLTVFSSLKRIVPNKTINSYYVRPISQNWLTQNEGITNAHISVDRLPVADLITADVAAEPALSKTFFESTTFDQREATFPE